MKEFILRHKIGLIMIIPGIIAGVLYWKYVGCLSGTCPLTSNMNTMMLFGALFGYFIGDSIDDVKKKRQDARQSAEKIDSEEGKEE